ncbi:MAG: glycoside hydrolase family 2 TIM barrel-domain containing protein, partial [Bacteroidota bacterium]|nr:glycoside hydrolase family 2 TIM barrel-domain containing protein [Bacteroidota bacterium]
HLPATHIKDLTIQTFVRSGKGIVSLKSILEKRSGMKFPRTMNLMAELRDASGKIVASRELIPSVLKSKADTTSYAASISIDSPKLWTAETPYLYTLTLCLNDGKTLLQQHTETIGIREISWSDAVLKLNGTPIKLRGVDHHDLSPINGRAMTEAELREDLMLIRHANINFIRTSHYPPQPRLLELCDSMGFYVMDEVPFGFGDEHLNDTSYLPILKNRAKATVWRDKNHPSVIVWSVGNENPLTKMCQQVGQYVKSLDPTRPDCFPQVGSYFNKIADTFPDSIDILAPHYPVTSTLKGYATRFNRPMIVTEYAHSLGLDFDRLESLWEVMYANPKLSGGAVWDFADQGILRKMPAKVNKNAFTTSVWLDSVTVYDNHGNEGADGIVYANRVPQVDYWQVRKVYSPLKALDDTLKCVVGQQAVTIRLINRYDFTNLNQVTCKWELMGDRAVLDSGNIGLNALPHDTLQIFIPLQIPAKEDALFYSLRLSFSDSQAYQFYEKTYPIVLNNSKPDLLKSMAIKGTKPALKNNVVTSDEYAFFFNKTDGSINLTNKNNVKVIAGGPQLRVGRKTTMSEQANSEKSIPENNPLWIPYQISPSNVQVIAFNAQNLTAGYRYSRIQSGDQSISGKIEYNFTDSNYIRVKYSLKTDSAKGNAMEAGISFLVPPAYNQFRWIGKGPYPAYPGKDRLDEFGFYQLHSQDLNFQGNREDVVCAVFSDEKGNGFALIADDANIAVERSPEGIVVSHNAFVSGRFNKFSWPEVQYSFDKMEKIAGSFVIIPLTETWPAILQRLFEPASHVVKPFSPFYHSYDQ